MDVWKVNLACSKGNFARRLRILSPDEKHRAGCIGSEPMRSSFALARIALRMLLGRYLDIEPDEIRFTCEARGKPAVSGYPDLCFSASRSGIVAAFAFCLETPIGIDVEALRVAPQMDRVVKHMFSECERRQLALFGPDELQNAFFACWTRKEAYAKAIGDGILTSFDKFCVDANPHEPRPRIHFDGALPPSVQWSIHDISCCNEHAAALAYRDAERTLSIFEAASVDRSPFAYW